MDVVLLCLALTVFHEARGEMPIGQQAVAQVVLNRAELRGLSVCEVVLEKGQFSWHPERYISVRKQGKNTVFSVKKASIPVQKRGWRASLRAAEVALASDNTFRKAEFFHSLHVKPPWRWRYVEVFRLGNHVFYARKASFSRKKYAFLPPSGSFS